MCVIASADDVAPLAQALSVCLTDATCFVDEGSFDDECARSQCLDKLQSCVGADETPTGEPDLDWAQVSAGRYHTCAIKQDGRLFCFGRGANGRLGTGNNDESKVPVSVAGNDTT